ncbi:MAG TPA: peptidyl-alpha-hydroxyglycine alpha-amidating lyase family protein [Bryobacteraceae bacterium]|jgi:DNA-binding beta-propeller fold protein YncE|nr:peptidyl-alpha-hydroxyglycine alpha-amidating lyase family protein [Bryobacteraceae bacterium]
MKNLKQALLAAALIAGAPLYAQKDAPEIKFDSVPNALQLPANIYLGEVAGVATNSRGNIFVYTRTGHPTVTLGTARPFAHGGSRLFEFDPAGKYVREIGKDSYGFMYASQVRIDPADNIWVVDQMTNMVMKFNPQGRLLMLLGRKAENIPLPARATTGDGAGRPTDLFERPTDVAWDAAGDIFVADGLSNARVAKFDKDGKFIKSWGKKGTGNGEFANVRSIAVDAQGNVYVADGGNKRIQVFDNDGNFKTAYTGVGNAQALCMTKGTSPFLYVSNSNPPNDIDRDGEIYKMQLDGTMVGKFGRAGKLPKEFGTVNAIDCRNANTLYVGEVGNLRVQKLVLH